MSWSLREHEGGWQWWEYDFGRRCPTFLEMSTSRTRTASARAWKVVLAYLMMDDRYLYLY